MTGGLAAAVDLGLLPELLGYQVRHAQMRVFQHFAETVGDGLTPGRFGLLVIVQRNPGMSQTALARAVGVDRSTMVAKLDTLERQGWLARVRSPADRRSHALHLTAEGAHRLERAVAAVRAHEAAIARDLGAEEAVLLRRLLGRLAAAAPR